MANSTGIHGYSTALAIDATGGTTYVAVAEIKKLSTPKIKVGASERTNLNSPSAAKEFVAGLIDAGEVTATLNWIKANSTSFYTDLRTNLMHFKITFPLVGAEVTASSLTFFGHIIDIGEEVPEDDIITQDVTFKVSGLPVFVAGS